MFSVLLGLLSAGLSLQFTVVSRSANLLELHPDMVNSNFESCNAEDVLSCTLATVNLDIITNADHPDIVLPTGDILVFDHCSHMEGEQEPGEPALPETIVYRNQDESEAVLTIVGISLYGHVELGDGRNFEIEKVEGSAVLWKEMDQTFWIDEAEPEEDRGAPLPHMAERMDELLAQGRADRTSVAEYTITVYYTAGLEASTRDVAAFVDEVIAETNEGYKNSKIPLRAKLHCLIKSDIKDGQHYATTLNEFVNSKSDKNDIRRSADVAILIVNKFSVSMCGYGKVGAISSGATLSVAKKSCSLGYYSFGHEIAHGFGALHDHKASSNAATPYAYGYIIKSGKYRTIMAYNDKGESRKNYYSSPKVRYSGLKTGVANYADNARLITENRFAIAAIGNEKMSCPGNGVCKNKKTNCDSWEQAGYCTTGKYVSWMKKNCKKSCKLC